MDSAQSLEFISAFIDSEMGFPSTSAIAFKQHHRQNTHPMLPLTRVGSLAEIDVILAAERGDDVDIESTDTMGWTALVKCAVVGDVQTCRMLIDKYKANVDHITDNGCTPLHYAILRQHFKVIAFLNVTFLYELFLYL